MEDEKPSCSHTFPEGSKRTGESSQVDSEATDNSSDWTSLEEEERRLWIDTGRENYDTDSSLSVTHCSEWKDEKLSYDADCSETSDEGKVRKLKYKGTRHGKLKRKDGNNTKQERDKSTACLGKGFSRQKQPKPNGKNEGLDANLTMQRVEKPHKCSECGKSYILKGSLRTHEKSHLKEKPYKCSECGKSYTCKSYLRRHKKSHLKEKSYKCSECGKSYISKDYLRTHERSHLREKPYKCSECGKSYIFKSYLRRHMKFHLHLKVKEYKCSECGKSYIYKSSLITHKKSHLQEKPHKCSECGKTFIYKSNLRVHENIHLKVRPYTCSKCGKSFIYKSNLRRHENTHLKENHINTQNEK